LVARSVSPRRCCNAEAKEAILAEASAPGATVEIDNSAAERALRGVALGRENWFFAGSDVGGQRAAATG
jgi:hypothetical protein